jgi:hypothetical protein
MFILIDRTNKQALARHSSMRALMALHYIQFANVDAAILREGANRDWAQFDHGLLVGIAQSCGCKAKLPERYGDVLKVARQIAEAADWLVLPFELKDLDAQAFAIDPRDGRPMKFNAQAPTPIVTRSWTASPQVLRVRADSTYGLEFSAGTAGVIPRLSLQTPSHVGKVKAPIVGSQSSNEVKSMATAKKAATKKVAAKKAAKKAPRAPAKKVAAKKAPAAPKAPSAPRAGNEKQHGITRPRAGGITAKVWETADKLREKKPGRAAVVEALPDISQATISTQYQRWRTFNGLIGRE